MQTYAVGIWSNNCSTTHLVEAPNAQEALFIGQQLGGEVTDVREVRP